MMRGEGRAGKEGKRGRAGGVVGWVLCVARVRLAFEAPQRALAAGLERGRRWLRLDGQPRAGRCT